MWGGIFFVGVVMAAGTLYTLDAALPGGLVHGSGSLRYAQTMAFTTLILFQLFNVFNARSDDDSAFRGLFENPWLWAAVIASAALQVVVVYTPFLQRAFSTESLTVSDWLRCAAVASSVLWLRECEKLLRRRRRALSPAEPARTSSNYQVHARPWLQDYDANATPSLGDREGGLPRNRS